MNEPLSLLTAWFIGLMGSTHCIGMCGGIIGALSLNTGSQSPFRIQLMYHVGRISTYGILGLAVGFFGLWLGASHDYLSISMRVFAGIMLVLMGIYVMGLTKSLIWLEKLGKHLWLKIQPRGNRLFPINSKLKALALGIIWGFLPCGLVYSTLTWAMVSSTPLESAAVMVAFGLGNTPAMLSLGAFSQPLTQLKQNPWIRIGMGSLILLFGLWTIIAVWVGGQ